jgi:hypothetical protein
VRSVIHELCCRLQRTKHWMRRHLVPLLRGGDHVTGQSSNMAMTYNTNRATSHDWSQTTWLCAVLSSSSLSSQMGLLADGCTAFTTCVTKFQGLSSHALSRYSLYLHAMLPSLYGQVGDGVSFEKRNSIPLTGALGTPHGRPYGVRQLNLCKAPNS